MAKLLFLIASHFIFSAFSAPYSSEDEFERKLPAKSRERISLRFVNHTYPVTPATYDYPDSSIYPEEGNESELEVNVEDIFSPKKEEDDQYRKFLDSLLSGLIEENNPVAIDSLQKTFSAIFENVPESEDSHQLEFYDLMLKTRNALNKANKTEMEIESEIRAFFEHLCTKPGFSPWCDGNNTKSLFMIGKTVTIETGNYIKTYIEKISKWLGGDFVERLLALRGRLYMDLAFYEPKFFDSACDDFSQAEDLGNLKVEKFREICDDKLNNETNLKTNMSTATDFFVQSKSSTENDYVPEDPVNVDELIASADACDKNFTVQCYTDVYNRMTEAFSSQNNRVHENNEFMWRYTKIIVLYAKLVDDEAEDGTDLQGVTAGFFAFNSTAVNPRSYLWMAAAFEHSTQMDDDLESRLVGYKIKEHLDVAAANEELAIEPYLLYLYTKWYFGTASVNLSTMDNACRYYQSLKDHSNAMVKDALLYLLRKEHAEPKC